MAHLLANVSPQINMRGCFIVKGAFAAFLLNKISNPNKIALADQLKSESE